MNPSAGSAATLAIPVASPGASLPWPFAAVGRLAMRLTGRQFLESMFWASLASGLAQILPLAIVPILSRTLPIEAFGRVMVAQSAILTFLGVANAGLGIMATRYAARYAESDPERLGRVIGLAEQLAIAIAVLCASALLFCGRWMAETVYGVEELGTALRAGSLAVLFLVMNGYQVGMLLGLGQFRTMAVLNVIQGAAGIAVVSVGALVWEEAGAVLGLGVAAMLNWMLYRVAIQGVLETRGIVPNWRGAWQEVSALHGFALPAASASILANVALFGANVFLVRSPDGVTQAAVFAVCYLVRSAVVFAPMMAQRVYSIRLTRVFGVVPKRSFDALFVKTLAGAAAYGLAVIGPLYLLRKPLLSLFGNQFVKEEGTLAVILLVAFLEVFASAVYQVIPASGQMWWQAAITGLWAVIVIGGSAMFAQSAGALAIAWVFVAGWSTIAVLYAAASRLLVQRVYRESREGLA